MAWVNPITWTAGTLTAANLNTLRDALRAVGDPLGVFAPAWTATTANPTLSNGTITGGYSAAGKRIDFTIEVLFGSSTTAGSGAYQLTIPVAGAVANMPVGPALIRTSSGQRYTGIAYLHTTSELRVIMSATDDQLAHDTIVWANGDRFTISGTYESA